MKRKIVRSSMAAHLLFPPAETCPLARSRASGSAGGCASQPTWRSALRQAWLAALPRGGMSALHRPIATACVAWAASAALSASAVILTEVPMQGTMLMPQIFYHEDTDSVTVDLSEIIEIAQLTPLLVSHPLDSFNPADLWYDYLDPSRQGLAFSRRYGFTPAADTGTLPYNRQLWIRKLSGSPGLGFFDYRRNATPKPWTPIFGTAGTPNATAWSGNMWHIGVTAQPGTNTYTATFEVYVVNTDTGLEVPGSGSGPFVLDWTDVPDGRPPLTITAPAPGQLRLAWPATATNWTPVSASAPNPSSWSTVTNQPVILDGQRTVTLECAGACKFFRMRYTP